MVINGLEYGLNNRSKILLFPEIMRNKASLHEAEDYYYIPTEDYY